MEKCSSPSPTSEWANYQRVLTLNNLAVNLIEHGLYNKATRTLKDALEAMKQHMERTVDTVEVDEMIERALSCLTSEASMAGESASVDVVSYQSMLVLPTDASDRTTLPFQVPPGCLRATRIELERVVGHSDDRDLHAILLLSNLGLATYLLSVEFRDAGSAAADELLQQSQSIFQLSSKLARRHNGECDGASRQILLLSSALIVTGNIGQIQKDSGQDATLLDLQYRRIGAALQDCYRELVACLYVELCLRQEEQALVLQKLFLS